MFSNFRMRPFGEFPLSQDDSNMDLAQEGMLLWGGRGGCVTCQQCTAYHQRHGTSRSNPHHHRRHNEKHNKMPDVWLQNKYGSAKGSKICRRIQTYLESVRHGE